MAQGPTRHSGSLVSFHLCAVDSFNISETVQISLS
jgi:hypothetical protein